MGRVKKPSDKMDDFIKRAGEIPDDLDRLAEEFHYKRNTIYNKMISAGIYTKKDILRLLKNGVSVAKIARDGNVTIEAVERIKAEEEARKASQKKAENSENDNSELLKQQFEERLKQRIAEIPDQIDLLVKEFDISYSSIYTRMNRYGIYNKSRIIRELQDNRDRGTDLDQAIQKVAQEGNVAVEAVQRLAQELILGEKRLEEKQIANKKFDKRFAQRASEIPEQIDELIKEFNISDRLIYTKMKEYGIYNQNRIKKALKDKTKSGMELDQAIQEVAQEGKVTAEAVKRVAQILIIEEKKSNEINRRESTREEYIISKIKEKPDKIEELKKELGISEEYIYQKMREYSIYNRRKIVKALKERINMDPEVAIEEIAREGNVMPEAVRRISVEQQEKERTRHEKEMQEKEENKTKKDENERKKSREVEVEQAIIRLAMQGTNVSDMYKKNDKINISDSRIYAIMKANGIYTTSEIVAAIKRKSGMYDDFANEQIAKEGNVSVEAVARIRREMRENEQKSKLKQERSRQKRESKEQAKRILEQLNEENGTLESDEQSYFNIKESQIIAETDDERKSIYNLLQRATQFPQLDELGKEFQEFNKYDIILILRDYGIPLREDVEAMITDTNMSDEEIAQKSQGSLGAIRSIRKRIEIINEILQDVPEDVISNVVSKIKRSFYISDAELARQEDLTIQEVKVIKERYVNGTTTAKKPEARRKVDYNTDMRTLRSLLAGTVAISPSRKSEVKRLISKILVENQDFLTEKDYAFTTFAYLKIANRFKAINFAEKYLDLQDSTISGVIEKLREVLESEKQKNSNDAQDFDLSEIGG